MAAELPRGRGADTVKRVCTRCHSIDVLARRAHTRAEWSEIVSEMMNYGAKASASERRAIIDYLTKTYPRK